MKRVILIAALAVLLAGCGKDGEPKTGTNNIYEPVPYTTNYSFGQTYIQTFYTTGRQWGIGHYFSCTFFSICNRIDFTVDSRYDENIDLLIPPEELQTQMQQLKEEAQGTELQYYMICEMKFTYSAVINIEEVERLTDWRIAIGKMEEYIYDGKIYERLNIIEEL